ncbi:hypothetical protein M9Y56_15955 [Pseudomonas juntendi]|uniref:alginate O-acetyltransferase AlgX-related protein n=1 Tax=Pseudomonas TaxID=286 RepID=UPI0003165E06|nr:MULTISPECIES: hypothetical protein [Pseudomonas]PPB15721.1 hypothetical protein HV87_13830 [Pseudomonas aeruginosa]MBA6122367.1 hypothetical protein [Pseudomonas juntendi]MBH3386442.1 hypothetical protein [Pseudomonas juntendi]MCF3157178.1 hypothetical protein [Pseudomonas juntendi]MCL8330595.1 hypothetical protein [Pseudomonas juntendi]
MHKQFKVIVRSLDAVKEIRCSLDLPKAGMITESSKSYLAMAGWIYIPGEKDVSVVVSHMPELSMPLNTERSDVKAVIPAAPVLTGFKYPVDFSTDFKVGVTVAGKAEWLFQVRVEEAKVLVGSNGHLFLDNDLNKSVQQFTGEFLIPDSELQKWDKYFSRLNAWSVDNARQYTFVVAPAKEYIYSDSYPHKKGIVTPLEQFYSRFLNVAKITDLTESLSRDREFAYYKTDSHWNDYGASLAASSFCRYAGFKSVDPGVEYSILPIGGDLGSKLMPVQLENSLVIRDREKLIKFRVYENRIKVRGEIVIYENPSAPNQITLMIFGDSFSVSFGDFLSHSFLRVVRIFSGADVDWAAVEFEKPDYILVETTSRFLIRSPSLDFSIYDEILRKYSALGEAELEEQRSFVDLEHSKSFEYYVHASRKALEKAKKILKK